MPNNTKDGNGKKETVTFHLGDSHDLDDLDRDFLDLDLSAGKRQNTTWEKPEFDVPELNGRESKKETRREAGKEKRKETRKESHKESHKEVGRNVGLGKNQTGRKIFMKPDLQAGGTGFRTAAEKTAGKQKTSQELKRKKRRKRVIQVWIRRILAVFVLVFIIFLLVWGVRKLFGGKQSPSIYGLPDYVKEEYLDINTYSRPKVPLLAVNDIVIHYTANPGTDAEANRNYFNNLAKQAGQSDPTYASSNFIVGLDGTVIGCVPIDEVAYASNNRNEDSISIETCHPDETGKFNEETYESLVKLTAWLCQKYGLSSENVIRHYDVSGKLCPKYFVENEDAWLKFRSDVETELDQLNRSETESLPGESVSQNALEETSGGAADGSNETAESAESAEGTE